MLLDDSLVIAERMKEHGVSVTVDVWDGLFHDFPIFSTMPVFGKAIPEFKKAIGNMKQFLDVYGKESERQNAAYRLTAVSSPKDESE